MMAAILPLMYVERGAQMTFVLQSLLLLASGAYLVGPLLVMAVMFTPLGIWTFGAAERYAKGAVKLKRVG
jgi:hypothetical protein